MSLTLLAPLALGLSLLILGPILAHMTRKRPTDRIAFGAMLLVERLVKRLRRRQRLKDLLLLVLRALAILLIVLGVSQPVVQWKGGAPEHGTTGSVVIILDDSMSMGLVEDGSTLYARARDEAMDLLLDLPEGVRVGVVHSGVRGERMLPGMSTDRAAVSEAITSLEVGFGGTDLVGALHEARGLLEGNSGEVHVFTDGVGPGVVKAAESELALLLERDISVIPHVIRAEEPSNLSIAEVEFGEGLEGGTLSIRVVNHGQAPVEAACTVNLPGGSEITVFVNLEPGGEVLERFTVPPEVPGGVAWVHVQDERLAADNAYFFHLPRVGAARVLVVDGDPGTTPVRSEVYFLERALAPWGALRGGVLPEIISPAGLTRLDSSEHRVAFLANVSDPSPHASGLVDFVREGGGLVISGGENVTPQRYNSALRDLLPAPFRKARNLVALDASGGVGLALPDSLIPLFSAFSRSGRGALSKIWARRVLTFEPYLESDTVRTLARWRGGIPAIVERRVGKGRVLIWTSTFDLQWGNAPLQSAFMPLVQRLVGELGGTAQGGAERLTAVVGERVAVKLVDVIGVQDPTVTGPDGEVVPQRIDRDSRLRFTPLRPGAYTVQYEGVPPLAEVAVNTPLEESNLDAPLELVELEAQLKPELFMRRAGLGLPALWLAVALWLVQSILARVFSRRESA